MERFALMTTSIVGRDQLVNFLFNPERDHRFCRICGAVFQSGLDRLLSPSAPQIFEARMLRDGWATKHAKTHTSREHEMLALSGRFLTPEAVEVLAPYGLVPLSDIVVCNEHEHAGLQAGRAPVVDAEHPVRS